MREVYIEQKIDQLNPVSINAFETHHLNDPFHFHSNEYELTLVLGGQQGLRIVGDNMEEFRLNDLVLIGPGVPHCWIYNNNEQEEGSPENLQVISVHFNKHILGEELLTRTVFKPIKNLFGLSSKGIVYGKSTTDKVVDHFLQFKLEPDFDTFLNILNIFNQLAKAHDLNTLCSENYIYKGKYREISKFESVFQHIQSNYLKKMRISEVASLAGMNDSAFSHYFKKRTRYSFTDFINLLRLHHAALQIAIQRKSIADICFESGFNNLSNFNRMFKKWKGETPLQYRKKQLANRHDVF